MPPVRRAVLDIGTNSVKLLVADVAGRRVDPLLEQSEQTRLGRGFYDTHRLQPEPIAHTARAVATFVQRAQTFAPASIRIIATSAARDAQNADELIAAVRTVSGLPLEIISGEQEALWVFEGVTSDAAFADRPVLILDVGGGSTEFIAGRGAEQTFRRSFRLGTVRLLERLTLADPPGVAALAACEAQVQAFLKTEVRPHLAAALATFGSDAVQLIGTGGTTTLLARIEAGLADFDRARIDATRLSRAQVRAQAERLWELPLAERRQIVGLPANRADVILTGVAIYARVMAEFEFAELAASTRGLRYAAILEAP